MTADANPLLAAAIKYAAAGLEVFPVREADKAPYTTNGMKDATTDIIQIERWWHEFPRALVGCRIPEDVVVLDTDPRHGGGKAWLELERQNSPIRPGKVHASGRGDGGRHNWFKRPTGKLSVKPLNDWARANGIGQAVGNKWTAGVDILHHGHRYTILPPSPHPETSKPYRWVAEGEPSPMPQWLAALITAPDTPEPPQTPATATTAPTDSIADWYSHTATWAEILTGWEVVAGNGETDGSKWKHPTATSASSASITNGCLFVYSPNAGLEETEQGDPHGYTKFRAYAEIHHDGDMRRAAQQAYERRDGPREDLTALTAELHTVAEHDEPPPEAPPPDYDDDLRALLVDWQEFWKVDHNSIDWLIEPVIAAGRSHAMFAPGGTGKSLLSLWLAVLAATGQIAFTGGQQRPIRVLYLDYEMTASDLSERLESMGYGEGNDLSNLHYSLLPSLPGLDEPEGGKAVVRLAQLVDAELVIIDTFGRAVHGDENDADTVRKWYRWTGLHLKHDGRAFLRVDHAGKDIEKGQRGTSAKNDDVDIVWQLSREGSEAFILKAKKRRMGWVPETVKLARYDDPLRYLLTDEEILPAGTVELADLLDELGVPCDDGWRKAGDTLRAAGHAARNVLIRSAQKYRRNPSMIGLHVVDSGPAPGVDVECPVVPLANRGVAAPRPERLDAVLGGPDTNQGPLSGSIPQRSDLGVDFSGDAPAAGRALGSGWRGGPGDVFHDDTIPGTTLGTHPQEQHFGAHHGARPITARDPSGTHLASPTGAQGPPLIGGPGPGPTSEEIGPNLEDLF